jgi:hypothetical protein
VQTTKLLPCFVSPFYAFIRHLLSNTGDSSLTASISLFTCAFTFVTSFDRSLVLTSNLSVLFVIAAVDASTLLSNLAGNSRKDVSKYFACWTVSSLTFSIVLASLLFYASNLLASLSNSFAISSFRLCFNASLLA